MIAAPLKFQVEALSLPVALQVGRAQFLGVTIAEICCFIAILATIFLVGIRQAKRFLVCIALVVAILGVQHFALMPLLQARSERIIAGEAIEESSLHLIYVVLETAKVIALLLAACLPMRQANKENGTQA